MSRRGLFVVGTDTGVGKTIVCAALMRAAREKGLGPRYLKPLATGGELAGDTLVSPDARLVAELCGLDEPIAALTVVCLREPLAPLAAARKENVCLDLDEILAATRARLAPAPFAVVEGIGGLMVPIAPGATVLDLGRGLGLPVLVVGRPGLGTINHTTLTIRALQAAGLPVAGFVFSAADNGALDPSVIDNPGLVEELTGATFLGSLPFVQPLTAERLAVAVAALSLDALLA